MYACMNIWDRTPTMQKQSLIDDRMSIIGSFNMDMRGAIWIQN